MIDTLLHDARHGTSGALVISGPAGMGKSAAPGLDTFVVYDHTGPGSGLKDYLAG